MVVIRTSLGHSAAVWRCGRVEVGDFVKYVSQLPSCSDLTNIRNILKQRMMTSQSPTPVNLAALFRSTFSFSQNRVTIYNFTHKKG